MRRTWSRPRLYRTRQPTETFLHDIGECAAAQARSVMIGGEPVAARCTILWNFVASDEDGIQRGRADGAARRMGDASGEDE